jgi:hypothetical protein
MARTEMMPKFVEKKMAPLRRLLLQILESQAYTRKGSVSTNCFPRVPPLRRMRRGSPLLPRLLLLKYLTHWTREFCYLFISILFLSLTFFFADSKFFLLRDDDEPKKDAAAAPLLDDLTISKEASQEETMVVKPLIVPPAKVLLLMFPSV